jgi:hypothetical protein
MAVGMPARAVQIAQFLVRHERPDRTEPIAQVAACCAAFASATSEMSVAGS